MAFVLKGLAVTLVLPAIGILVKVFADMWEDGTSPTRVLHGGEWRSGLYWVTSGDRTFVSETGVIWHDHETGERQDYGTNVELGDFVRAREIRERAAKAVG